MKENSHGVPVLERKKKGHLSKSHNHNNLLIYIKFIEMVPVEWEVPKM